MPVINWLRQGIDFVLSANQAISSSGFQTIEKDCLLAIKKFSLAKEVFFLKNDLNTSSVISTFAPDHRIHTINNKSLNYIYTLHQPGLIADAGLVSLFEKATSAKGVFAVIPVKTLSDCCYILIYDEPFDSNAEYADFLEICRFRITELFQKAEIEEKFEKLTIRFGGILKTIPQSIVFIENNGEYCWVNENAARLLNIPAGNLAPQVVQIAMETLRSAADNRDEIENRAKGIFKDMHADQWYWKYTNPELVLNVQLKPVQSANIKGVIWVLENVTNQYKYDERLNELNRQLIIKTEHAEENALRYQYVTKASFDAIWDWDLVKGTLYKGEGFQLIFGHNLKDWQPDINSWAKYIHPNDLKRVTDGIYHMIDAGETYWNDEYLFKKHDGQYAHVADRGIVIRDENGKAIRMVGAMRDVTESKLAQSRIRESEFNMRAIFESSVEGFVLLDDDYKIKAFNSKANDFIRPGIGYQFEVGRSVFDFLEQESLHSFRETLKIVSVGKVREYESMLVKADGAIYWVQYTITPVYEHDSIVGTCITARDITVMKNHLQTIEQQNKAFKEISWTHSHLVRAPLARIMSITSLLRTCDTEDETAEMLALLDVSTAEFDSVIRQITNLTIQK